MTLQKNDGQEIDSTSPSQGPKLKVSSSSLDNNNCTLTENIDVPEAAADTYWYVIEIKDKNQTSYKVGFDLDVAPPKTRYWLGMAGLDVTSTGTSPQQQWFAAANLMQSLWSGKQWWSWLNVNIGSIPTQKTSALSSLTSTSTAVTSSGIQTIGDISQSFGFRGGITIGLPKKSPSGLPKLSVLLEVGATSPLNGITGAQEYNLGSQLLTQFQQNPIVSDNKTVQQAYPQLWSALQKCTVTATSPASPNCPSGSAQYVAFILPSRTRFYRSWGGGLRLKTPNPFDSSSFPGITDLTFGQDETVTAGMLRGVVMALNSEYPVSSSIRVFGSVHLRLSGNKNNVTLNMTPVTSPVSVTDSSVVLQSTLPADQDYFRIGVGVDIVQVVNAIKAKK
ncbi:MAG TPA: hypothetical protein VMT20_22305 [Terriglobia bacterium]|nr:hypothetical protein [Terriglobia bacterium]